MIRFFRKIRQQLLTENKFSRYLLYAIGEILLVMIGILLALQVNNGNEQRKLNHQKKIYKQTLIKELDNQIEFCLWVINTTKKRLKLFDNFFYVVNNPKSTSQEIQSAGDSVYVDVGELVPPLFVMSDLIESGHINYFSPKIREEIISYYRLFNVKLNNAEESLDETKIFRNEWYSQIDLAYYSGKINEEHTLNKGWNRNKGSIAFLKRTNFFMYWYWNMEYMIENFGKIQEKAKILKNEIEALIIE